MTRMERKFDSRREAMDWVQEGLGVVKSEPDKLWALGSALRTSVELGVDDRRLGAIAAAMVIALDLAELAE